MSREIEEIKAPLPRKTSYDLEPIRGGLMDKSDKLTLLEKLRAELCGSNGLNFRYQDILCSEDEDKIDQAFASFLWAVDQRIRELYSHAPASLKDEK